MRSKARGKLADGLMLALVATQVAFCLVIPFGAGLFVTTFE